MLNEVSCWYWDWSAIGAIGTWIGGIGALAAAVVAIYIAKRDESQRREFAKFLFSRDLERLSLVENSLKAMERKLRLWCDPDDCIRDGARQHYGLAAKAVRERADEFEYLARSDQQFHFRPNVEILAKLNSYPRRLKRIGETVSYLIGEVDEDVAADHLNEMIQDIEALLEEVGVKAKGT